MRYLYTLSFFFILLNIIYGGELSLFVNPSAANNNKQCGSSIQSACDSIVSALASYSSQNSANYSTTLTLQLMDGNYTAPKNSFLKNIYINTININSFSNNSANVIFNGFNATYPFLNYLQTSTNIPLNLLVNNVTFINSTHILNSTSTLSVTFDGCVFRDVLGRTSIIYLSNSNVTSLPSVNFINSQFFNVSIQGKQIVVANKYLFVLSNMTMINCVGLYGFDLLGNGIIANVTIDSTRTFGSPLNLDIINSVTIRDSVFNNNTGSTGAIAFEDETSFSALIQNSNFTKNKSLYSGAIYLGGNRGSYRIVGSNFLSNQCVNNGGALSSIGNTVSVQTSTFVNNTALKGGALYATLSAYVYLNSVSLSNNSADEGGAVYTLNSFVSLNSAVLTNNSATYGNDVECTSSTLSITPSSSMIKSNYWCPYSDCTFRDQSNFQCPTDNPPVDSSSSHSKNNTHNSSSTNDDKDKKKGLDRGDIIAIAVCVSVVGVIIILILMCLGCRKHFTHSNNSSGHVRVNAHYKSHHESSPLVHHHHDSHHHNHHNHHHHNHGHHHGHHHHHGNH
ncbi:hypothetical protein CYY_008372 [Polysphondylium violaceum]|uniref:C2H2-type domain-containing protein n=1 Tax=Polysphondylium violaceum TaxID=133409 RepID=A0A8J4V3Z9_9MYCE|nr:hypothetical protein CYY_008372 [Polysphondylium violaceum]